jgi:peptidoglycan/xylan/chitin deacetylase (PgdA/CDA1 family)
MKRILIVFILAILAAAGISPMTALAAPGDNLIANSSMETAANTTTPSGWTSNKWGTNTANFNYLTTGHTGSRSVRSTVTSYTDGDAKWYFTPVNVTAGKSYTFSDFYKANVGTEVIAQFTHQDNSVSYQWLGSVVASTPWAQATFTFAVPTGATKASVFHVLPAVGSLTIDDASLNEVVVVTPPPAQNLIANPSVETASGTTPASWLSSKWGTNAATFTYPTTGHTGSRSVKTQVTSYTDGDAKWYFTPVNVTPGTRYTYKDYYQSNVATDFFAWFTNADGTDSYEWLGTAPASTGWQQSSFSFTVPATAQKVSVFHLVSSVGWLTTDDAELRVAEAASSNPVPNPSLEQASASNPNAPDRWLTNKWGTNTANFEYSNEGYNSAKSAKVTVSNYTDGDAKWYFEPQQLEQGKSYRLSFRYRTNTTPQVSVMHLRADGSDFYAGLPKPLPSGNTSEWQLYTDTFTVPADAVSTSAFMFVNSNGWAQTDDYLVEPYEPTGFNRPLVTLTFDDGQEENAQTALPVMTQHGLKSTQCYATTFADGNAQNSANIVAFHNAGHEICSHSVTHPFLTQVSPTQLATELTDSKAFLEQLIGAPVRNFATPYGDYDGPVVDAIMQRYRSHRGVDEGYNSKDNFDVKRIRVQNMLSTTTLQQYQQWLDYAKATNTWLVLVYHRVADDPGEFDTYETDFGAQMNALTASGITVKTYNDALDELTPQL